MVDVEVKDGEKIYTAAVPYLSPEQILEYLISKCDLQIPEQVCEKYWTSLENTGDELALRSKPYRDLQPLQVWPLGIHGDEANMGVVNQPRLKIIGMFLNVVVFRPTSTRMSRFLLFSMENTSVVDVHRSINPILREIVSSLNRIAEDGVLGRRCLLTEIRGDQQWIRFLFQQKSYWGGVGVCFKCEATTRPTSKNYLSYDGWVSSRRSTDDFIRDELPLQMSLLVWNRV